MISQGIRTFFWKVYIFKDTILKKRLYTELHNIAKSLEEDIFLKLQKHGITGLSIEITEPAIKIDPLGQTILISKDAADFFKGLNISKMEMDVFLESNQIMDIWRDVYAMETTSPMLLGGYKAYCAITRFTPESGLLSMRYNYCELDYSKAVRGIKEKSTIKDHRVFFRKAPRYGLISGLLVIILGLIYPHLPKQLSIALSIIIGLGTGILVFLSLQILGSLEYDKEYLEKRLKTSPLPIPPQVEEEKLLQEKK